jgi:hypothetical protein
MWKYNISKLEDGQLKNMAKNSVLLGAIELAVLNV